MISTIDQLIHIVCYQTSSKLKGISASQIEPGIKRSYENSPENKSASATDPSDPCNIIYFKSFLKTPIYLHKEKDLKLRVKPKVWAFAFLQQEVYSAAVVLSQVTFSQSELSKRNEAPEHTKLNCLDEYKRKAITKAVVWMKNKSRDPWSYKCDLNYGDEEIIGSDIEAVNSAFLHFNILNEVDAKGPFLFDDVDTQSSIESIRDFITRLSDPSSNSVPTTEEVFSTFFAIANSDTDAAESEKPPQELKALITPTAILKDLTLIAKPEIDEAFIDGLQVSRSQIAILKKRMEKGMSEMVRSLFRAVYLRYNNNSPEFDPQIPNSMFKSLQDDEKASVLLLSILRIVKLCCNSPAENIEDLFFKFNPGLVEHNVFPTKEEVSSIFQLLQEKWWSPSSLVFDKDLQRSPFTFTSSGLKQIASLAEEELSRLKLTEKSETTQIEDITDEDKQLIIATTLSPNEENPESHERFVNSLTATLTDYREQMKSYDIIAAGKCFCDYKDFLRSSLWSRLVILEKTNNFVLEWMKKQDPECMREILFHSEHVEDSSVLLILRHQSQLRKYLSDQEVSKILSESPLLLENCYKHRLDVEKCRSYIDNYVDHRRIKELMFSPSTSTTGMCFDVLINDLATTGREDANLWCVWYSDLIGEEALWDKVCGMFRVSNSLVKHPYHLSSLFGTNFGCQYGEPYLCEYGKVLRVSEGECQISKEEERNQFQLFMESIVNGDLEKFKKLVCPSYLKDLDNTCFKSGELLPIADKKIITDYLLERNWVQKNQLQYLNPGLLNDQISSSSNQLCINIFENPTQSTKSELEIPPENILKRDSGILLSALKLTFRNFDFDSSRYVLNKLRRTLLKSNFTLHCVGHTKNQLAAYVTNTQSSCSFIAFVSNKDELLSKDDSHFGFQFLSWILDNMSIIDCSRLAFTGYGASADIASKCPSFKYESKLPLLLPLDSARVIRFEIPQQSQYPIKRLSNTKTLTMEQVVILQEERILKSFLENSSTEDIEEKMREILRIAAKKNKFKASQIILNYIAEKHGYEFAIKIMLKSKEPGPSVWNFVLWNDLPKYKHYNLKEQKLTEIYMNFFISALKINSNSKNLYEIENYADAIFDKLLVQLALGDSDILRKFKFLLSEVDSSDESNRFIISRIIEFIRNAIWTSASRAFESMEFETFGTREECRNRVKHLELVIACFESTGEWTTKPFWTLFSNKIKSETSIEFPNIPNGPKLPEGFDEEATLHILLHPEVRMPLDLRMRFITCMMEVYPKEILELLLRSSLIWIDSHSILYDLTPLEILDSWDNTEEKSLLKNLLHKL